MSQGKHNTVAFINHVKYSDSLPYDISTTSGDYDTNTLLPEAEEESDTLQVIQTFIQQALKSHLKLFIFICDILCVFTFTLFLITVNALRCENSKQDEILEWCKPFEPVDKIVVDLNFDLLVHCDMPKSCVAYAEILMEKQGFNYNFIIGDEDLVYVGKGFQCRSDALRMQMLITRYTWDPMQPVYKIPEEVVVRYSEIVQEGLQCGMISPNYTVTATCSVYGEWCGADNIRDQIPWTRPGPLALAHEDRDPWRDPPHGSHPFQAFHLDRVYDSQYRLQTCNRSLTPLI